jgi:hypothetical protein
VEKLRIPLLVEEREGRVPGVVSITAKTVAAPIVAECMPVKLPSVKIQCKISNFCGNIFPVGFASHLLIS